jgi:hypothetical protein
VQPSPAHPEVHFWKCSQKNKEMHFPQR